MEETNKKIEKTIRVIKEEKADKEKTKEARKVLEQFKQDVKPDNLVAEQVYKKIGGEIKVGDWVQVKDNGAIAEVLNLKNKEAEISIGDLKSMVKLSRLEKVSRSEVRKKTHSKSSTAYQTQQKLLDFSTNLDLRGKRGEEVLPLIQNFIDEGYMLGIKELRIVHGKGDGILREITRNLLRTMPNVQKVQDEHADRGGAGVSLVTLK